MRRSLRTQILYPILGVMIAATLCAVAANAWSAARRSQAQIERKMRDVARTLAESSFPLTDAVLRQTRGLSGAEFAVLDGKGNVLAASLSTLPQLEERGTQKPSSLVLDETVEIAGERYFHVVVKREPKRGDSAEQWLHIFYPEQQWRRAWREAVAPPIVAGGAALLVMAVFTGVIARRWTRPIVQLQGHVERIAEGDFAPAPLPPRDDEIRDLAVSVNRMAQMLSRYEEEVRRRERLRTLGQLGGGIAHQMRNAVTGCRMAIDLYRRQSRGAADDEHLDVAVRQLELMENYLRRFLTLGAEHTAPTETVDLGAVVADVIPLVRPFANHLRVDLIWRPPEGPLWIRGDEAGLAQIVVNLTLNAIEAAAGGRESSAHSPQVEVQLGEDANASAVRLKVIDTGPGPAPGVQEQIFEPLVSDKPDGAGLGLTVVREVAHLHRGDVHWERRGDRTHFVVNFPRVNGPTAAPTRSADEAFAP